MSTARLRWSRDAGCYVDRYGRDAARCWSEAQTAADLAEATRRVVDAIEAKAITLGRDAGPKLVGRYLVSLAALVGIAERDRKIAAELDSANADEAERARLAQPPRPLADELEAWVREVGRLRPLSDLEGEINRREQSASESLGAFDRMRLRGLWAALQPAPAATGGAR